MQILKMHMLSNGFLFLNLFFFIFTYVLCLVCEGLKFSLALSLNVALNISEEDT